MADLTFGNEFRHRADRVFDRRVRIDTVLVEKVDVVGREPPQRTFDRNANVLRSAIEGTCAARHVGDPAELRCEHDLVAAVLDRPPDELLVGERAVRLRGIQERGTEIERAMDRQDGLCFVGPGSGVGVGHPHRPQPDAANVEAAELRVLHRRPRSAPHDAERRCLRLRTRDVFDR
jgi:hypothetical protein